MSSRYCHGVRLCYECAKNVSLAVHAKAARLREKRAPRIATEAEIDLAEAERHRLFVERVKERDGYRCQLCPTIRGLANPLDAHHLEPGPNKIKREKLSNTLTAHRSCHEAAHMNEAAFVPAVKAWAAKHGYPLPHRKVYR